MGFVVRNRLLELIEEKERAIGRKLSYQEVADHAGVSQRMIYRWTDADSPPTRYDAHAIQAFCRYFNVEIGDLLILTTDKETV